MNMTTRTIAKRAGTYMQPGQDGVHVNRVTLLAEPWAAPEVEAVHPRPASGIFEPISVRTPQATRPRAPIMDRFSAWDEDTLREEWMEGIAEGMRKGHRPKRPVSEVTTRPSAKSLRAVMDHLAQGPDTRTGIMFATRLSHPTMDRVSAELRDTGMVVLSKCGGVSTYTMTPRGHVALAERVAADTAPETTGGRAKQIYDFLLGGAATRLEIKTALGLSDWKLDDALALLEVDRGLKRKRVSGFSLYSVSA